MAKKNRNVRLFNPIEEDPMMARSPAFEHELFGEIPREDSGDKKQGIPIFLIVAGAAVVGLLAYAYMRKQPAPTSVVSETQTTTTPTSPTTTTIPGDVLVTTGDLTSPVLPPTTPTSPTAGDITAPSDQYWDVFAPTETPAPITTPSPFLGPTPTWSPVECTEGQYKCVGVDQYKCVDGFWKIYSANSPYCGYVASSPTSGGSADQTETTSQTPPPTCTEGGYQCFGTTRQKCIGGVWQNYETNSDQCGYLVQTTTTPEAVCVDGSTRCNGTTLQRCTNNAWQDYAISSPDCGYVAPPVYTPVCTEGAYQCVGTTRQKCTNNAWQNYETNSTSCGYVAPGCTNPTGALGEYRCVGYTRWVCMNNGVITAWQPYQLDSPACGYVEVCPLNTTRCVGTTKEVCLRNSGNTNNEWVTMQTNSTDCGYVPPSACTEGNEKCEWILDSFGYHKYDHQTYYRCVGGKWVPTSYYMGADDTSICNCGAIGYKRCFGDTTRICVRQSTGDGTLMYKMCDPSRCGTSCSSGYPM